MNADQARERFSDAYDGELSEEERRTFEAALTASPALAAEFESFCATMRELGRLATGDDPPPELLPRVQAKLRARSGGRFYRDRFAQARTRAWFVPIAIMLAIVAMVGLAWLGFQMVGIE